AHHLLALRALRARIGAVLGGIHLRHRGLDLLALLAVLVVADGGLPLAARADVAVAHLHAHRILAGALDVREHGLRVLALHRRGDRALRAGDLHHRLVGAVLHHALLALLLALGRARVLLRLLHQLLGAHGHG